MKNKTAKKKKLPYVLLTILIIAGALASLICVNASRNMKEMNATVDAGLQTLSENAGITALDAGEYKEIKMYGLMKFNVSQYEIKELGTVLGRAKRERGRQKHRWLDRTFRQERIVAIRHHERFGVQCARA